MCKKCGGSILDATESVVHDFGISEQEADVLVRKFTDLVKGKALKTLVFKAFH